MIRSIVPITLGLLVVSCNSSSTAPGAGVSLSFAVQNPTVQVQSDELIITKAQVVLRKMELQGTTAGDCSEGEDDGPAASDGEHHDAEHHEDDHEGCEEFRAGPFLLDVPLDKVETTVTVSPPAGTYREAEFQIHKVVGNDADDQAFLGANPSFMGKSIHVEGTFNGTPFSFDADLSVKEELDISPPLVITDETSTNITVRIDLSGWFKGAGGALVSPLTANKGGVNEVLVRENIRRSFKAFEDKDCDGHEDHSEH